MIQYIFRDDEPLRIKAAGKADAQVFGEAIAAIAANAGGRLSPKNVVDAARDKKHALHKHFEWDDAAAAESFRLEQARSIIRVVRVVDDESKEGTSRAFLSVNEGGGVAYRHIGEVKSSATLQMAILAQADRDLDAFERRYRSLSDVCDLVKLARDKIAERRANFENRAAA